MLRAKNRTLAATVALALACGAVEAQTQYWLQDLGVLPGFDTSMAFGIDSAGRVVGESYDVATNTRQAFLFESGTMTSLGTLPGGRDSRAFAINDWQEIVGESDESNGYQSWKYGFYFNGSMSSLSTVVMRQARGRDINSSGMIAGRAVVDPWAAQTATVWSGGANWSLGSMTPGGSSEAYALNDSGTVVGEALTFDGFAFWSHAFVHDGSGMLGLGTLGGASAYSRATDINEAGVVVGQTEGPGRVWTHAFRWKDGAMTDIGALVSTGDSFAEAINDSGLIVGASTHGTGGGAGVNAVLWEKGGIHQLHERIVNSGHGWVLVSAQDINNNGAIVGYGYAPSGLIHAFKLNPLRFQLPPPRILLDRPPITASL
jgi:probable HAF family extracellular repeat protein